MAATPAWSASEPLRAKSSRSSRRRAQRRYAKIARAVWCQWPGMAPFQPGWEVEPGTLVATYQDFGRGGGDDRVDDDEDETVVILDDTSEEEEELVVILDDTSCDEEGDDDDDDVEAQQADGDGVN